MAIQVFVIFHLVAFIAWGMPSSPFRTRVVKLFASYINGFGLWHGWDMFAPVPLGINFNFTAKVEFEDGRTTGWAAPRMERLSLVRRFQKERYRKWRERILSEDYQAIWGDTARFIARQFNNSTNPPAMVYLTRSWSAIPPPAPRDFQPMPPECHFTNSFEFFRYPVKVEDLE